VAAAGLPLVGTVTVKDSLGETRTAAIGTNGLYSINVNGMTAPFVFRATGTAGGRTYQIHAGATQADVGGVINVTPLTDLVLSNVAGEIASAYFERNPDASLTTAQLNAESLQLRQRLLPILTALGVDSTIDLLRTPFTPLASALDKALDLLRVDYSGGIATITNLVTNQQITDAIATPAASEGTPPQLTDITNVATAGADLDGIRAAFGSFSGLFANGLPSQNAIVTQLSTGFLHRDQTASELGAELASFPLLVGAAFTDVVLVDIDYAVPAAPVASVSFAIRAAGGQFISAQERDWQLIKQNGIWRLHGDQRVLDVEVTALMVNNTQQFGSGPASTCRLSGFTLLVEDYNTGNNGGEVAYVLVTGPGLSTGARLTPNLNERYEIDPSTSNGGFGSYYVAADACNGQPGFEVAGLAAVPDNATYTFTAYNVDDELLQSYEVQVPRRPLTLAELATSTEFPSIAQPTFANFASYSGGDLSLSASGIDPGTATEIFVSLSNMNGSDDIFTEGFASASGQYSDTVILPTFSGVTSRILEASSRNGAGRKFIDRYVVNSNFLQP